MTLTAIGNTQIDLATGQQWVIRVEATALPTLVITLPDGEILAPAIEFEIDWDYVTAAYSTYVAYYVPVMAGRYIAAVAASDGGESVAFQAWAADVTSNVDLPDAADLDEYLGGAGEHSWSDAQLTNALNAEAAAQRRVCRIPAAYPDDLREALLRRASRNLYMRKQLTELPREDTDFPVPAQTPPGRDPEVRRLESPWRKVTMG